jgi:tRNA nucleotidyltransferase/poly(A) polymerase
VKFGHSPEEDATRRDFTCNAIYLDPLTDEVLDPVHGLRDLEQRRLDCVGDARRRFAEDGLRLVRMARFAGGFGLEPTAEVLAAARASGAALRGVSRERVLIELEALMARGGVARALGLLEECGLLERTLQLPAGLDRNAWVERRAALFSGLPARPGTELGLAALFAPDPERAEPSLDEAVRMVESLKPSRDLRAHLLDVWDLEAAFRNETRPPRSTRVRWMQRRGFEHALELSRARARTSGTNADALESLAREHRELRASGLDTQPYLTSKDLSARNVAQGPLYGALLREAETLQLDGVLADRDAALAWLDRKLQDGGNAARKPSASG